MGKLDSNDKDISKNRKVKRWTEKEIDKALKALSYAKKGIDIYHVIWRGGDFWGVLREGCKRMYKIHNDKQSAVAHAKRLAQKSPKWEVVVHKEDASLDRYIHPSSPQ
jgi:hypothetical protein